MKKLCLSYQIPPLLSLECAEEVSKQSLTLLPSQYENICTLSDKLTPFKWVIDSVFKFCDRWKSDKSPEPKHKHNYVKGKTKQNKTNKKKKEEPWVVIKYKPEFWLKFLIFL